MKELLNYLVENIVEKPEEIEIKQEDLGEVRELHMKVSPSDMGRVIGREGKVIRALRSALKVASVKSKTHVNLVLDEDEQAKS